MARNNLPGLFLPFSSLIRSPKNSPGVHATCEFCKRSAKGKLRHEFLFRARVKSKLTEIDHGFAGFDILESVCGRLQARQYMLLRGVRTVDQLVLFLELHCYPE